MDVLSYPVTPFLSKSMEWRPFGQVLCTSGFQESLAGAYSELPVAADSSLVDNVSRLVFAIIAVVKRFHLALKEVPTWPLRHVQVCFPLLLS